MVPSVKTTFNGVYNNPDIPVYGKLRIKAKGTTEVNNFIAFAFSGAAPSVVATTSDGSSKLSSISKTEDLSSSVSTTSFYFADGEYSFDISNKYNITAIQLGSGAGVYMCEIDLGQLKTNALSSIYFFNNAYAKGNLNDLNLANITRIHILGSSGITGDIGKLVLNSCTLFQLSQSTIYGNIEEFVCPNTTMIGIAGCSDVYGDLKVWAEKVWNNGSGKTTGSIQVVWKDYIHPDPAITWDGDAISLTTPSIYIHFSQDGVSLSANA